MQDALCLAFFCPLSAESLPILWGLHQLFAPHSHTLPGAPSGAAQQRGTLCGCRKSHAEVDAELGCRWIIPVLRHVLLMILFQSMDSFWSLLKFVIDWALQPGLPLFVDPFTNYCTCFAIHQRWHVGWEGLFPGIPDDSSCSKFPCQGTTWFRSAARQNEGWTSWWADLPGCFFFLEDKNHHFSWWFWWKKDKKEQKTRTPQKWSSRVRTCWQRFSSRHQVDPIEVSAEKTSEENRWPKGKGPNLCWSRWFCISGSQYWLVSL